MSKARQFLGDAAGAVRWKNESTKLASASPKTTRRRAASVASEASARLQSGRASSAGSVKSEAISTRLISGWSGTA
jgi:hypothetical protein